MKRVLSGIQSSGSPHLGNYLGAMKNCIDFQNDNENYVFVADLHALTTIKDKNRLKKNILEVVLDYMALGLDPSKTIFYRQSDLPEHSELTWIFSCITPLGMMERAHAWKDALSKKKKDPTIGLFTYPILMAADILLYNADLVPVGKDQKQHVEIARDIAEKFNSTYGVDLFKLPQEYTPKEVATIIGTDGEKMSKSYGNTIEIFADKNKLKKQVMSIKTDSIPLEDPKNPETCNVFKIYSYFASDLEIANLRDKYLAGGYGYGDAKKLLLNKLLEYFGPFREKRIELEKNMSYIEDVLREGANKARVKAQKQLAKVKKTIGLIF
ncbi:tryptophan--tRNA ligase [Candidatus Peregrinibacteria bacterium]|nr:tryptophan--tRNA ligase [Candidatus Peregrinibacteria bacterium]